MVDLAAVAGTFGHRLHDAGIPVTSERSARFANALALIAPATYTELYWTARVTLLSDQLQIARFDHIFGHVFAELADYADTRQEATSRSRREQHENSDVGSDDRNESRAGAAANGSTTSGTGDGDGPTGERLAMTASADERLHRTDFAALTPEELARMRRMMTRLRVAPPPRRSRRRRRSRGGAHIDQRATIRRSHRSGGDPVQLVRTHWSTKPRRVIMLADVSGSMEPYARAYLQLLMSAVGGTRAEAFVLATRLTRLTRHLRSGGSATAALQKAAGSTPDWAGGTRLGSALKTFVDEWGRRGMARRAIVVIVSDGWETGDAAVLGEQMARLQRLAHRIIWVNPRKQLPTYEPIVAGMAAALPYVDVFVSGHSTAAMEAVTEAIANCADTSR
jgi:uncharacterized protein